MLLGPCAELQGEGNSLQCCQQVRLHVAIQGSRRRSTAGSKARLVVCGVSSAMSRMSDPEASELAADLQIAAVMISYHLLADDSRSLKACVTNRTLRTLHPHGTLLIRVIHGTLLRDVHSGVGGSLVATSRVRGGTRRSSTALRVGGHNHREYRHKRIKVRMIV